MTNIEDREKTVFIQIRIDKDTKEEFMQVCNDKAINSSKLIRQLIVSWLHEQQDSQHRRQTDIKG